MARKLPRLQRVLGAPALASVAYGEIASSIYFALGILALHALGFTPLVLGLVGLLFLLVSLSYAEGTTAVRETGGAATFVRIAFNDLAGFLTGWALFLDYLIVIALSALFMPHYLGTALHVDALSHKPWDVVVAVGAIVAIAFARAFRRPALYTIAIVGLSAFPAHGGTTALGTTWLHAPLVGIVSAFHGHLPNWFQSSLRVYVGITGALVLLAAASTSMSGFGRLAYSLGEHGQLPAVYGRLNRRTLVAPVAIASAAGVSIVVLVATSLLHDRVSFLASLFSFGVLLAFTAAQLAVIRLRMVRPDLRRPFRVPLAWRGVPVPSAVGALATALVFVVAMVTHRGARYGGPSWLGIGLAVYLLVRRGRVGSSIATQLDREGWDVVAVDEKEEALSRLGSHWSGGFIVGHGMDVDVLREAGIEEADAVVVATNGDNTNLVIGQVAQKRFDVQCVVVRVLDPARADFYRELGLRTVCPTKTAIEVLTDAVRACEVPAAIREPAEARS